jgi:beta-lactamase regulating signal transducer with metallopeptidase domain/biopolymer transport protein ExbD
MNMLSFTLPEVILLAAAGIAAGSLVLSAIGLVAAWTSRRRSLPMRHGLLLATLVVVALLPVLIPWLQSRGLGWDIRSERPDSRRTLAPLTATFRQSPDSSTTLELPTDGSLQGDGMTVAEVMARYAGSTAPTARRSTPAAPQHEFAVDVLRLSTPVGSIACLVWLAGSCLSLFRATRASRRLRRLTQCAGPVREPLIAELLTECAKDAGLARIPALVSSNDATVPYVSGLWRPGVVLPLSLLSADEPTLRGILLHELAHIRRRDLWVGLVQRMVAAAYWWNPLVHRLNARLAEVREDLCDNYVLAHIPDPRDYAQTLVDLASQATAARVDPSMGLLNRSPNRLSGRIQRILQEDRPMATRLGGVSKVLLTVFVFALGAGSTLFVIRLPDFLPETGATAPAFLDAPPVVVESEPEPMISLVRNDAVASTAESANWDVVVFPPIAASEEAAASKADAVVEIPDLFVPTGNSLPSTVPDVAPPDAFANDVAPLAQRASSTDFGTPPSAGAFPLEPPPGDATTAPPLEPLTPDSPFALTAPETQPVANDGFSELTTAEPAPPPKALVLVELTANADGSVKQLRYLTEGLGNDDAAFQQLEKQIVAWAGQYTGGDLTVQIVADPQLRYEHVARVTKLCAPLVTRVVLAEAEIKAQVTITVGFVRDAQGRPVVATPVVFWQDEVVRLGELQSRLESWIHSSAQELQRQLGLIAPNGPAEVASMVRDVTLILRCDSSVQYTVVESIMKEARQAGFEHFSIQAIGAPDDTAPPVSGEVLSVDSNTRTVWVSIGSEDGLRPGFALCVFKAGDGDALQPKARLEVTRVQADSAQSRVIEEDLLQPIAMGDIVQKVEFRKVVIDHGRQPTTLELLNEKSKDSN